MNKLIENYNSSVEALQEYFNCVYFGDYVIQECPEDYFQINGEELYYGSNLEEAEYSCEIKETIRKEDLTAIRVESDFGGDDFWNIFYTNKEAEFE